MCKSHKFLMISNCDFLSSDIVISKSASGVRGPGPGPVSTLWTDSGSGSKWASHISSPVSRLTRPGPLSLSLSRLSSLPTLYIRLEMEMSRDPATGHRHHNPEKAQIERTRAISWWSGRSGQLWSDEILRRFRDSCPGGRLGHITQ